MDKLIDKLAEDGLSPPDERQLLRLHHFHFKRRVSQLDSRFFPGREKTSDGITSLGGEAYASFCREPTHEGEPAFRYVVRKGYSKTSFLYYWRNSATIQFLRRVGDTALRERLRLLRNIRIHLSRGFVQLRRVGREWLWTPADTVYQRYTDQEPDIGDIASRLGRLRGKAAILQIFRLAQMALTRAEIAAVLTCRACELSEETRFGEADEVPELSAPPIAEDVLLRREARERAVEFWKDLDDEERRLLAARGHGRGLDRFTPYKRVAKLLPTRSAEGWRLIELSILRRFAERFSEIWEAREAQRIVEGFAREVEL